MSEIPMIPLGALRLSQTASQIQRRQFFDKDGLEDLALSITSHGVLQPIIVRPLKVLSTPGLNGYRVAGQDYMSPDEAEAAARDQYEIIAGERRFLAAQQAGLEQIPANVLDVSDETVVEIQLIENLEREDVHPMHEAESYDELVHKWRHPVDELCARLGKSRAYVYGRMKLLSLSAKARRAFYEGLLSTSIAEKLARIPSHKLQDEALPELTGKKWRNDGEPLSYRRASELIESNFMLELKDAPFPTDDPDLNGAGPCAKCPKRTGNAPDLFDDIKGADVCTDTTCFDAKTRAWGQRAIAAAKKNGVTVIVGKEAKKLAPNGAASGVTGFHQLDGTVYDPQSGRQQPVKQLLKPGHEIVLLQDPKSGRVVELVPEAHVKKPTRPTSTSTNTQRDNQAKAKVEHSVRVALFKAVRETLPAPSLRQIAELIAVAYDYDSWDTIRKIDGKESQRSVGASRELPEEYVRGLKTEAELQQFIAEAYLAEELHVSSYTLNSKIPRLTAAAEAAGVDVKQLRRDLAPQKKEKTKTKNKAAKRRAS